MSRTKKDKTTVDAKPEEKKKRGCRLAEQCEFATYITDGIVPYIAENTNEIERIGRHYVENKEISKKDWMFLHNIVDECCNIVDGRDLIVFDKRYMTGKYSKAKHSTFFMVQTGDYAKYMVKHIEESRKWDVSNTKEIGYYHAAIYLVAQHIFFFVNVKEKLGLTD